MMERTSDMEPCFSFDLTAFPTALFTENRLSKTDKSALAKEIQRNMNTSDDINLLQRYVVDGGCLRHRVVWRKNGKF